MSRMQQYGLLNIMIFLSNGINRIVILNIMIAEEFEEYAEKSKTLPDTTTNESKLCLYSLYKQATVGPVNTYAFTFTRLSFHPLTSFSNK
ncbi:Acyl-CoA-binding protein [Hordeum vulgare]|nr:Acyl-CoA-binding protein [Hordeum vulgare]